MSHERWVMHLDMDAFFAAIEQQVNPALRGRPVIIGGRDNRERSIICAASYEAKARGIKNAMPSWQALQICPEAVFVPADTAKYVYTSTRIHALLKTFSPRVEKFSVDEFFLDPGDAEGQHGSLLGMAQAIKQRIRDDLGISGTIGIAPTKVTAKLVAKQVKPDGVVQAGRQEVLALMRDLPVEKLCGIGERLRRRFDYLGIRTCGQLADYPVSLLQEHFGVIGLWLRQSCRVEETDLIAESVAPPIPPKSIGHSQTLRECSRDKAYTLDWIYLLSEMVARRMRHQALQGRTVYVYVSDGFSGGRSRRRTFREATDDGAEIFHRCRHILETDGGLPGSARVLGVSVSGLVPADHHYLFVRRIKRQALLQYLDRINDRYGEWTICPAALKSAVY